MEIILYLIVGIGALLFFGVGLARMALSEAAKSKPEKVNEAEVEAKLPYLPRKGLLTANELSFYRVLLPMIGPQWQLFAKVRMEDIIEVPQSVEFKERQSLRGRIKSRHVDFAICDANTLEVLMCIELDDKSHQRARAKEADAYNDRAMRDAGVPLIRVPARHAYSEAYVKSHIFEEEEASPSPRPDTKLETSAAQP